MKLLLQLFAVFFRIGAFTIGGGYVMIGAIRVELLKRGWIEEDEYDDLVVMAQTAPGLLAVNIAIFAGHRIAGTKGSIAATLGAILPPFIIMLLLATVFTSFQDNPYVVKAFKGMRPAVVALIAVPVVNMAKKGNKNVWMWILSVACFLAVTFLSVNPVYILLVVIVVSVAVLKFVEGRRK